MLAGQGIRHGLPPLGHDQRRAAPGQAVEHLVHELGAHEDEDQRVQHFFQRKQHRRQHQHEGIDDHRPRPHRDAEKLVQDDGDDLRAPAGPV